MSSVLRGSDDFDTAEAVAGQAKAWVNFSGAGTVTIRDSFNVSSITDDGVGDYIVNFINNMVSAAYSVVSHCNLATSVATEFSYQCNVASYSVSGFGIKTGFQSTSASTLNDVALINCHVLDN